MIKRLIVVLLLLLILPTFAQDDTLPPLTSEAGFIAQRGDTQTWTFFALAGEVYSVLVESTTQTLDPILEIRDENGETVISNDDYAYPETLNALVEAITIPRTGNYEITVSGFGETTGGYRLQLLPGYAEITNRDAFDSAGSWSVSGDDTATMEIEGGELILGAEGVATTALATGDITAEDFYAQVDVTAVSGDGWTVGLALRGQNDNNYYRYNINARGQWRFTAVSDGDERVIRDFAQHPAITAGETAFTLGVLANETGFEVFYNGQTMGQVLDDTFTGNGEIGIFAQAANAVGAEVRTRFDNLAVTTPLEIAGEPVFPQQIIVASRPQQIIAELERRRVIAPGGSLPLNVPESFVDSTQPGAILQPLGRGATYSDFVMGTTTTLTQTTRSGIAGCGLLLQQIAEDTYTVAFVDNDGGYGISERDGDTFEQGLFDTQQTLSDTDTYNLIVVIVDGQLRYFVDGAYVGTLDVPTVEGEVGNILLNYEAVDSRCQFDDTWLWDLN